MRRSTCNILTFFIIALSRPPLNCLVILFSNLLGSPSNSFSEVATEMFVIFVSKKSTHGTVANADKASMQTEKATASDLQKILNFQIFAFL